MQLWQASLLRIILTTSAIFRSVGEGHRSFPTFTYVSRKMLIDESCSIHATKASIGIHIAVSLTEVNRYWHYKCWLLVEQLAVFIKQIVRTKHFLRSLSYFTRNERLSSFHRYHKHANRYFSDRRLAHCRSSAAHYFLANESFRPRQ